MTAAGMTADQYVLSVVGNYSVATGPGSRSERVGQVVAPLARDWAGQCFAQVAFSGSYAKGTAVSLQVTLTSSSRWWRTATALFGSCTRVSKRSSAGRG